MSLLKQFVQEQPFLPEAVKELHKRHNSKRTRPSLGEIEKVLLSVVITNSGAFIMVDALDEYNVSSGRQEFLSSIFKIQIKTGYLCYFSDQQRHYAVV